MDWSKYSSLKSGSKVSFGKEKQVMKEAVSEVQDSDGKVNNCKKRMINEWLPKLYADDSVSSIPASEDEIVALIVARDEYKNRVARDAE